MTLYAPHLLPKLRSTAIMEEMQRMPCTLRISSFVPGHRCASQNTVVGAHLPIWGKGTKTKCTDLAVVAACLHCHDLLDRRDKRWEHLADHCPAAVLERTLHAITETWTHLILAGVIVVPDAEMTK